MGSNVMTHIRDCQVFCVFGQNLIGEECAVRKPEQTNVTPLSSYSLGPSNAWSRFALPGTRPCKRPYRQTPPNEILLHQRWQQSNLFSDLGPPPFDFHHQDSPWMGASLLLHG